MSTEYKPKDPKDIRTVTQAWTDFVNLAFPKLDPKSRQYFDLEKTFLAGALSTFVMMVNATDLSEDEACKIMDGLSNEIETLIKLSAQKNN